VNENELERDASLLNDGSLPSVLERLAIDMTVTDIAGNRVGDVTGLGEAQVRVRLLGGKSVWLKGAAILTVHGENVRLVCWEDRLRRYVAPTIDDRAPQQRATG
jgi:hypothetical protein